MQQNTVYLNLSAAQHVSGGITTHHKELITLYLQYLALTFWRRNYFLILAHPVYKM